jgi:hypothetical protein
MDTNNGLQLQHFESSLETEPTYYMQHQQSLAKVLSPCRYQHGVSRNKLFDYSYGAGELIVCNRGIDEFVRWNSEIQILKVDLPDEAFRAIAEEAGAETVEIQSSTKFEDKRVAFASIFVISIAVGIGAATSVFTLLNALVLRPLPLPHPEQHSSSLQCWRGDMGMTGSTRY